MPRKCFEYAEKYGDIVQVRIFNTNIVLLNTLDFLQKAVSADPYKRYFNDRAGFFYGEHFLFGGQATRTPGVVRGLVDLLLDEQDRQVKADESLVLTEERLQGIVLEIIAAAIVAALCSESAIMSCLLNNPEWQTRVQAELDKVIGRERRPRLEDREHCPVLEAVAMEAQRLITVIPLGGPHFCRENIAFEEFDVPANTLVLPNLEYIHHNEAVWGPDAWEFRPERFMDDTGGLLPRDHPRRRKPVTSQSMACDARTACLLYDQDSAFTVDGTDCFVHDKDINLRTETWQSTAYDTRTACLLYDKGRNLRVGGI
ncbi:cytochrome P450 1A1-like [Mya arenaria]|uniref:cytochrome P450 1A1-like n=1 Tax=Mya arenaria TaxID=6604 RepID=UPI0022E5D120|nr:cytochrome P450 1A1-like [Mya arenaria]